MFKKVVPCLGHIFLTSWMVSLVQWTWCKWFPSRSWGSDLSAQNSLSLCLSLFKMSVRAEKTAGFLVGVLYITRALTRRYSCHGKFYFQKCGSVLGFLMWRPLGVWRSQVFNIDFQTCLLHKNASRFLKSFHFITNCRWLDFQILPHFFFIDEHYLEIWRTPAYL